MPNPNSTPTTSDNIVGIEIDIADIFGEFFDKYAPEIYERDGSAEDFFKCLDSFIEMIVRATAEGIGAHVTRCTTHAPMIEMTA